MAKRDAALLKRQQIARASRMMFLWVAVASVIIGAASVSSIFMIQEFVFNQTVINEKNKTVEVLEANNKTVESLQDQVRVLSTNSELAASKSFPDEETIRVVLDALPDTLNTPALGASIQQVLVNIPNVELDSLVFEDVVTAVAAPVEGADASAPVAPVIDTTTAMTLSPVTFTMKLIAQTPDAAAEVLTRLERSIRAINVKMSKLEVNGAMVTMTITGEAYYQTPAVVELSTKPVGVKK
ncbi:MAG: hypothetical protein ACSLEY_04015 [Candidatus Saccharimonadales bacterium]